MLSNYEQVILELEKELLKPEVRKSPEKLRELLSEDFMEYCSSGKIYKYNPNDIFFEEHVLFKIVDFTLNILANNCVLATYKVKKINSENNAVKNSIRSSIWKYYDNKWKMIFHQGTPTLE